MQRTYTERTATNSTVELYETKRNGTEQNGTNQIERYGERARGREREWERE